MSIDGKNPNPPQDASRLGGMGSRHIRGEHATVRSFNPDTYVSTVYTERGQLLSGVQQIRHTPGAIIPLAIGTEVLLTYDYGPAMIAGYVASPASANNSTPYSVTGVSGFGGQGANQSVNPEHGSFRKANEPTDVMPGDFVHMTESGNMLGVLAGGVNVLKSSPLAQIRTHLLNDLVEVFSRNYKHVTDMGITEITNKEGKINMSFRGGSDQSTEAGSDEEKWSIRFDLGADGDIFNFELTTPLGQVLFRIHVDAEGQCEIFGINGVSVNSGAQSGGVSVEDSAGNKRTSVGGDRTDTVAGNVTRTINGSETTTVDANHSVLSGNDVRLTAMRDVAIASGRSMNVQVMGPLLTGDALTFNVATGNFSVNVGEIVNPLGSFNVTTQTGDTTFTSELGGNFKVDTQFGNVQTTSIGVTMRTIPPDSVVLGGSGILTSHVAKFEQLAAYINALHQALDYHVHDITVSPVPAFAGPFKVTGATGFPLIPISPPLAGLVPLIQSIYVGVGG